MLKITRATNGEVVIKLSGWMDAENLGELEKLISAETDGRRLVLDLKDLTLMANKNSCLDRSSSETGDRTKGSFMNRRRFFQLMGVSGAA